MKFGASKVILPGLRDIFGNNIEDKLKSADPEAVTPDILQGIGVPSASVRFNFV